MRLNLPAAVAVAIVSIAVSCCGSGGRPRPVAHRSARPGDAPGVGNTVALAVAHTLRGLQGDWEDDEAESRSEGTNPAGDYDNDQDNDYLDNLHKHYFDPDDTAVSRFGHAAERADARSLIALVRAYVEASAADDGAGACALLADGPARSAPQLGQVGGPGYLRGARGCAATMTRVLERERTQLPHVLVVTGVRVSGTRAYVLLGSRTKSASYLTLQREGGRWRVGELLATQLP